MILEQDFHGISIPQIKNSCQKEYYRKQINLLVKDKTVVDLGAGNGILSFMAIEAGAKKVFAIEKNKLICLMLTQAIKKIGFEHKIIVINADFLKDDISKYLLESDICVSEIINLSFTNNIFPKVFKDIKEKYNHLMFIPDKFCYQLTVIENKNLNEEINWGYHEKINSVFDRVYLEFTVKQPFKWINYTIDDQTIIDSTTTISYNFNDNIVETNYLTLPHDKLNKWLEIYWHFDGTIYNNHWQREYIPLSISWFNNVKSIGIEPNEYYHKIKKINVSKIIN